MSTGHVDRPADVTAADSPSNSATEALDGRPVADPLESEYPAEAADRYCLPEREAVRLLAGAPWRRFVVLGDSIAEGVGDAIPGYRPLPWADRVTAVLRGQVPDLGYTNLGVRGQRAAQVGASQLEPALRLCADGTPGTFPSLSAVICGGNDMFDMLFDAERVEAELDRMVSALRAHGDVITMGLLDITHSPHRPPGPVEPLRTRLRDLGELTARVAARHGALHVPASGYPADALAGPRIYSADWIHLNSRGHALVATQTIRRLADHLSTGTRSPSSPSSGRKEEAALDEVPYDR